MIDVETNQALGLAITDESVLGDQMFIPLLDQTQRTAARNTRCTEFSRMVAMTGWKIEETFSNEHP